MHSARLPLAILILAATALAGCASRSDRAPVADISKEAVEPAATARAGGSHVVKPGDTLYKIAQENNIPVARLAELNRITDPSQLRVGQVLRLDGTAVASTPTPKADADGSPDDATPSAPDTEVKLIEPVEPIGTTVTARASDAGAIDWGWPSGGKVTQGFNSTTKGIDLAGDIGDPVSAAAGGDVIYVGNGVRGLGNLVLIGHSDGFITAYAHNEEILVKAGQSVKKGDKIATLGQSDTDSPRLHFQIRRRNTSVDPLSYLPAR